MRESSRDEDEIYQYADPIVDEALNWLVRMEAGGTVEASERAEFEVWLNADAAHRTAWNEVRDVWSSPEVVTASRQLDAATPVTSVMSIRRARPGRLKTWALPLAASLALIVGASHFAMQLFPRISSDYSTAAGERREVTLPDGSLMVLNTGTAVDLDFSSGRRGVRIIQGEAWFDVVHDAAHPFHVVGDYGEVQVKGTAFSVEVEGDSDTAALQRGSVDVVHRSVEGQTARLVPGEMVIASKQSLSPVSEFDVDDRFAWLQGRIVIESQPFDAAIAKLERYFGGRVLVLNNRLRNIVVSGDYRTDRAETAIDGLTAAAGGTVTRLPGGILVIH
ncbi:DUF4880 domain-containing protein (plasmid) [Rhizobium grahamii]|uniref:DUF4880 domain-containing protein n=1 Tax=Rhizobium grahamii TaxID=1120045 RepID=A0A5Q0CFC3_9HYPH|nr:MULTISPECIES: FecR domain-containing protein [Rhizobium]QFY62529.1 DUF4880 domain-containing protein [Rhizobium grahamii]QRM52729.1 DUF4880 domain-containing protein [Rhizobium sp. BG6]